MWYGSSLVTFYNKKWDFVLTVRQSLINWPLSVGYIVAVGACLVAVSVVDRWTL